MGRQPVDLVFTKAAIGRVLNTRRKIESFEIHKHATLVIFMDGERVLAMNASIKRDFARVRQQRAQGLHIHQEKNGDYRVWNPSSGHAYTVRLAVTGISCECQDYVDQCMAFSGRGCCKHGYAVLGTLGHTSLGDYLKANSEPVKAQ